MVPSGENKEYSVGRGGQKTGKQLVIQSKESIKVANNPPDPCLAARKAVVLFSMMGVGHKSWECPLPKSSDESLGSTYWKWFWRYC